MSARSVPLGMIANLVNGRAFKPEEWSSWGTPIVRIQNLNDLTKPFNYCAFETRERFRVQSGDLLFSWSGTPGTSFGAFSWDRGPGVLNQHIFRVDINEQLVDKAYLRYALNSLLQAIIGQSHGGVGLKHITKGKLEATQIPLPPLPEQRRIAAILDKADALRAKRREAIAKLDQLLQSVFLDMFGDPNTNPKCIALKTLEALSDPKDRINYGVVQPGDEFPGGVPVIRVGDIEGGAVDAAVIKRIDPKIEAAYGRSRLKGNELLVSCVGSIGNIATVPSWAIGYNIARAITRVPLANPSTRPFVQQCLMTPALKHYFKSKTRTVSQPTLNVEFVKSAMVFAPPADMVQQYCALADQVDSMRRRLDTSLTRLNTCFSSLQQRAFSDGV